MQRKEIVYGMSDLISRSELIRHIENEYREYGEDYDVEQILGDI